MAEPGEFTLRAFLAGRLDLVQAEAVLGVIDAADRRELDVALSQLAGGLSGPLASLRDELLDLLADLEAGLDFTEEDLLFISAADLQSRLAAAAESIRQLLQQMRTRTRTEFEPRVRMRRLAERRQEQLVQRAARQLGGDRVPRCRHDARLSNRAATTRRTHLPIDRHRRPRVF